jgi:Trk-type K+ transport system membrane component
MSKNNHIGVRKMRRVFLGSYVKTIVTIYAMFTLLGTLLLKLPFSIRAGQTLSFIDAFFVSVSGTSVTGLSSIDVATVLTPIGLTFLALIMQFGGVGLMLFLAGFWILSGKKISLKERSMVVTDQNQLKLGGIIRLVKDVLVIMLLIEAIGFILISSHLYLHDHYAIKDALFNSFFLTISLFTNAGFDPQSSMMMFANHQDYFVLTVGMILMFSGSVGYWVLVEVKDFIAAKSKKEKFHFSIYVKLIFWMHLILFIGGALLFFLFEMNHFLSDKNILDSIYYSFFMSLTTRNAGFSTLDITQLNDPTHLLFIALMFIGASPNSVGGGIRTTCLVILVYAIYSFSIGRNQVVIMKRAVKESTIYKSLVIFTTGIMITFTATILLTIIEPQLEIIPILFEVFSAFGTTGLSLGITSSLTTISKLIIIFVMFVGRVGIVSLLLFFKEERDVVNRVKYPEFDMIVGA